MSPTKTAFQQNEDLAKWWVSVYKDPRFHLVTIHALAEFIGSPTVGATELAGARSLLSVLNNLGEQELPPADSLPSPNLQSITEGTLRSIRSPRFPSTSV